jgi:septum site-determining protein MinC
MQSFKLKGSLFTLSVLQLFKTNLTEIEKELSEKIILAPKFFYHAPIVIDLHKINDENFDLAALKQLLEKNDLIPVGVRGGSELMQEKAKQAGFAIISENSEKQTDKPNTAQEASSPILANEGTRIITHPIRSGQQVYAQGGDLIVISSVSSGAELLADGNIHVYGALRGRALAGLNGNKKARIFCLQLDAELVSIAGEFKVFEQAPVSSTHGMQIYLKDDQLTIDAL